VFQMERGTWLWKFRIGTETPFVKDIRKFGAVRYTIGISIPAANPGV
jgi:hypothetical protein